MNITILYWPRYLVIYPLQLFNWQFQLWKFLYSPVSYIIKDETWQGKCPIQNFTTTLFSHSWSMHNEFRCWNSSHQQWMVKYWQSKWKHENPCSKIFVNQCELIYQGNNCNLPVQRTALCSMGVLAINAAEVQSYDSCHVQSLQKSAHTNQCSEWMMYLNDGNETNYMKF